MKILHTADWHLGQNFYERDRLEEQLRFLDFLLEQIQSLKIDVLIVAGDIFDTANPPRAAEQAYYDFLTRLHALQHCQAVIIGGNHDSAPHLDAPRRVLSKLAIHVVGSLPLEATDAIFRFEVNGKRLCIAALPFLRDRDVRRAVEGESFEEMEARTKAGILESYHTIARLSQKQPQEILIATGHLTAVGGRISDSERSIHIGNLGSIGADQFPKEFDYVALGHLHHPQSVGKLEHIRYSGSPIPLSFSESSEKELRLLTIEDDHTLSQTSIPIPLARRLLRLEGSKDGVLRQIANCATDDTELSPWIEVTLTDNDLTQSINDHIRETAAQNGAVVLKVGRKISLPQFGSLAAASTKAISEWAPMDVFEKRLESYAGDTPAAALKQCFNTVLQAVQEGDER